MLLRAENKKNRKVYDDREEMVAGRKQCEVFSSYLSRRNEMGHEREEGFYVNFSQR